MADEVSPSVASTSQVQFPTNIHYDPHKRDELARAIKPPNGISTRELTLQRFAELLNFSTEQDQRPKVDIGRPPNTITSTSCTKFLNTIVAKLTGENAVRIQFHEHGSQAPEDGRDGTLCRPGLIAHDKSLSTVELEPESQPPSSRTRSKAKNLTSNVEANVPAWAQLEATAEFHSSDDTLDASIIKALSYTAYHLLTRPDRVIVPGFYFSRTRLSLILTGASGTCYTNLEWTNTDHMKLLRDFVYRVIKPSQNMIDPTITRNPSGSFDIHISGAIYNECELLWLGRPIGRRTTIFLTNHPTVRIIKEQYLHTASVEAKLVKTIHRKCRAPGVVLIDDHQEFRDGDMVIACTIGKAFPDGKTRYKSRLALEDLGTPIMGSQTPYDILTRIYDLLEATRFVYTQENIIHRDISDGNVLFRKVPTREPASASGTAASHDASTFCSVLHLLNDNHPPDATEILVIDWEHSAVYKEQGAQESAGTPIFVARAAVRLQALHPGSGAYLPFGMPDLIPEALERYKKILKKRWEQFPARPDEALVIKKTPEVTRDWYHELRHDAESCFWLLVWWAIRVRPDNDMAASKICPAFWAFLVAPTDATRDARKGLLATIAQDQGWLDPAYAPMEDLIRNMALYLQADLHWVTKAQPPEMKDPEYLHEVFQRHIFNFLVKNKDEPFLSQGRHIQSRAVEEINRTPLLRGAWR